MMVIKFFKIFKITSLLFVAFFFSACSTGSANITKAYLNRKYSLWRAGDLHGLPPTSNEVLDRNPGFTSYINLFDKNESFINYQCKGTSYQDFYCEASFKLVDINGDVLIEKDGFRCSYTGGQTGKIIYEDNETQECLGVIYVYTPYWCRWQFEYDVTGSGDKILLTFEFWKSSMNPLPDFITPND